MTTKYPRPGDHIEVWAGTNRLYVGTVVWIDGYDRLRMYSPTEDGSDDTIDLIVKEFEQASDGVSGWIAVLHEVSKVPFKGPPT